MTCVFILIRRPPTPPLFPYTTLFRSISGATTYEFVLDHLAEDGEWPYKGKPCWVLSSRDLPVPKGEDVDVRIDRKSTRLNSSHRCISYAVFCLKKKTRAQEALAARRA